MRRFTQLPLALALLFLVGSGCGPTVKCGNGEEIELERVEWWYDAYLDTYTDSYNTPYLPFEMGFNGNVYETREAWDALIAAIDYEDPIPREDFTKRDAILYGLDGCDRVETSYLGACEVKGEREIQVRTKRVSGPVCADFIPYYDVRHREDLARLFPRFWAWQQTLADLDPDGRFDNRLVDRLELRYRSRIAS